MNYLLFILPQYLAPLQRIISTENLSYIPNLYFRKYKLIESLNHQRYDFPEQKLLLPRQKTSWDALLCQVRQKAQLRNEIKKYKIAQNYHVCKTAKQQFIKKQLKKQERTLFHRIVANQLSQEVGQYFKNFQSKSLTNGQMNHKQQKQQENKKNQTSKGRVDDIFIDKQADDDYLIDNNAGEIDFFDDILNDGVAPKQPLQIINQPGKQAPYANANSRRSIKQYVSQFIKQSQQEKQKQMDLEGQQTLPTHISRKSCLKRINQNLRKRLKTKGAETQDRSLTSATVSLSNLINNYPECRQSNFIEVPSEVDWIFDDGSKNKRKRDQDFELNWDDEEIEKFKDMNQKFGIDKIKQSQTVLQLTVDKKQFPKLFERNISSNYKFPSKLQEVKNFSQKFQQKKFYFNQFHDKDYEKFIIRNNKRRLLQKFQKNSNYMFAQNYVQDQLQSNEKVSIGKMFLHPPSKISDRLIYKITPGTTKLTVVTKDYNKKNAPLPRQKIILLSYLVNKYLTQFGNNWKTITQFIQIFPCFSNYLIKPQLVQQLYQMINRHQLKINYLDNLQIWDKKLLPSNQIYNQSYKDYDDYLKQKPSKKILYKQDQMTDESQQLNHNKENSNFSLDNFQKYLKQPLNNKKNNKSVFHKLSKKYHDYSSKLYSKNTQDIYNFNQNKIRKANKIIEQYRNSYAVAKLDIPEKPQNEQKIVQYVQENLKGQIKSGMPFRKKKNINQRNNQLVKILQALRSKNTSSNMPNTGNPPKNISEANKVPGSNIPKPMVQQPPGTVPPSLTATQPLPSKPSQSQGQKQQKQKNKTPQKRVGGAPKKKKKQGQQQKKTGPPAP